MVERNYTAKLGHRQKTVVNGRESVANYGQFIVNNTNATAPLMADGSGLAASKFLNSQRFVRQCNHSNREWVRRGDENETRFNKPHDNTAENSFRKETLLQSATYGFGSNKNKTQQYQDYCYFMDWIKTFTDGSHKDIVITFLEHLSLHERGLSVTKRNE